MIAPKTGGTDMLTYVIDDTIYNGVGLTEVILVPSSILDYINIIAFSFGLREKSDMSHVVFLTDENTNNVSYIVPDGLFDMCWKFVKHKFGLHTYLLTEDIEASDDVVDM